MSTIRIPRTGEAPLVLRDAELIAEAGSRDGENYRWHELTLYRLADGRYCVHIQFMTVWDGEVGRDEAYVCRTPAEVRDTLVEYGIDPVPPRVGFPGPHNEHRQRGLEQALRVQYNAAVSELLDSEEFAVDPDADNNQSAIDARDLCRYRALLADALARVDLTRGEACLVLDAIDGLGPCDPDTGFGSAAMWPASVEDHLRTSRAADTWGVDADALMSKLREMDRAQLVAIADAAERFWRQPERDTGDLLVELGLLGVTDADRL